VTIRLKNKLAHLFIKVAKTVIGPKKPKYKHQTPFELNQCDHKIKKQKCPFFKK
jgi:hypothetical protein